MTFDEIEQSCRIIVYLLFKSKHYISNYDQDCNDDFRNCCLIIFSWTACRWSDSQYVWVCSFSEGRKGFSRNHCPGLSALLKHDILKKYVKKSSRDTQSELDRWLSLPWLIETAAADFRASTSSTSLNRAGTASSSIIIRTVSRWPPSMAFSSGVKWLLMFIRLMSAPWLTSSLTTSVLPLMAAISRTVQPYLVTLFGSTLSTQKHKSRNNHFVDDCLPW